jgi:hypothetical protein
MEHQGCPQGGGETCPRAETVMISMLLLLAFLIIAVFAIRYPSVKAKRAAIAINAALAGALGVTFIWDVATSKLWIEQPRFGD